MKKLLVLFAGICLLQTTTARATRVLQHYDVDSLTSLSELVVEVQLGANEPYETADGNGRIDIAKVLAVFKGQARVGDSLRINGLDPYSLIAETPAHEEQFKPLASGDIVYLFLAPNGHTGYAMYGLTNAAFTVIESGVRYLDHGRIYTFSQGCTSGDERLWMCGGFIPMTETHYKNPPIVPQKEFEQRLAQSVATVQQIDGILANGSSPELVAKLKALLSSRREVLQKESASDDVFAPKLLMKLKGFVTPKEFLSMYEDGGLGFGFFLGSEWELGGADCRPYVLARVADHANSPERRLECANILAHFGNTYAQKLAKLSPDAAKQFDCSFASKMAKLAVAEGGTNLVEPLLGGIADCEGTSASNDPHLVADLTNAASILSAAFSKASSADQYQIAQTVMQIDGQSYRKLPFSPGPLLTRIQPADDFQASLQQRKIVLTCEFRSQMSTKSQLKLVFRPLAGGAETEVPVDAEIGNETNTFGYNFSIKATVPPNVNGKCNLFLRDYSAGQANGDGIGFTADIPAISKISGLLPVNSQTAVY